MIITDDNKAQVGRICSEAMTNRRVIDRLTDEIATLKASLERHEEMLRETIRERERYRREIRALGFHDIGHARTELSQIKSEDN